MRKRKYNIIGITGPTGSGKTTLSVMLKDYNCAIVNADKLTRKVYLNTKCIEKLKKAFGNSILNTDGSINRKALAKIVFSSEDKLNLLNQITNPLIIKEAERTFNDLYKQGYRNIVFDAPTLIESGFPKKCDIVISVIVPIALRIKRITKRDEISDADAKARVFAQHSDIYYISQSDIVIDNNYNEDYLLYQIKEKIVPILI